MPSSVDNTSKGTYLLDFYCPEANLCVECDGLPHFTPEEIEKDRIRTGWLNEQGIEVIRFTCQEIENDTQHVLQEIDQALKRLLKQWSAPHPPTPTPSEYRREGELVQIQRTSMTIRRFFFSHPPETVCDG